MQNSPVQFLREKCVRDPGRQLSSERIYDEYLAWCSPGERSTRRSLGLRLSEQKLQRIRMVTGNRWGWDGVRMRIEGEPPDQSWVEISTQRRLATKQITLAERHRLSVKECIDMLADARALQASANDLLTESKILVAEQKSLIEYLHNIRVARV